MARGNKKTKLADLPAQSDPSVELDSAVFLRAAQPVLKQLEDDLIARAKASPTVTAALKARHASEKASKRTADAFPQWQQNFIDQVAAAWLLSCVFVRTLEDRSLLGHPRIAGPGASDSQKLFFQMAPSLTERDYLLTVFRELTHFDAARDLFDAQHNPVWLVTPSAEAAKALLALFRLPTSDTPAFRFGQRDTRFLGDLYQDLNERVRKRFALLQTPRFVESFILDRTLERALDRFGLDDTTVIDPTCGSGHFLLGSFDRLYEHRLRADPGLDQRLAAHNALDAVFGADINPYAVGIARFRLTLSFIEKAGFKKLVDAPHLPLHLVVADSLLHNPHLEQTAFADLADQSIKEWRGQEFSLEDEDAAREVLHRKYAAVVGNPPYITVKDKSLRYRYRELYPNSAAGKYSLAAPFAERFFQLGRDAAYVGMITANSFMKREFGKKLIERYLPTINLDIIINTSGAYIPGHGTPTVLLFGTAEEPQGTCVLTVLANRGEPTLPKKPEEGRVWSAIEEHWNDNGFDNEYITVTQVPRDSLSKHPWSLSGGGASELKSLLETRSEQTLGDIATVGVFGMTNADDILVLTRSEWARQHVEAEYIRELGTGAGIRDWGWSVESHALYPYRWPYELLTEREVPGLFRYLWPYRTVLWNRATFGGGTYRSDGRPWWQWHQVTSSRVGGLTIACAEVATHNHFALDSGGRVFNQTAPILKLSSSASTDDHLALLAYLNSSTSCFWLKQVCVVKGTHHASEANATPYLAAYQFNSTKLSKLPIPHGLTQPATRRRYIELGRKADSLQASRSAIDADCSPQRKHDQARLFELAERREKILHELIAVQEEIDWLVYEDFGLASNEVGGLPASDLAGLKLGERPFEIQLGTRDPEAVTTGWFRWHGSSPAAKVPDSLPEGQRARMRARLRTIRTSPKIEILESEDYKRRWIQVAGKAGQELETDRKVLHDSALAVLETEIERVLLSNTSQLTMREIYARLEERLRKELADTVGGDDPESWLASWLQQNSVPFLAAHRYSETGARKFALWEACWDLQRQEDKGTLRGEISAPPTYSQKDFQDSAFWRYRGKFDVPKEKFISYPGCESDEDAEPLYGWAGWNQIERMQTLAAIYQQRKKVGWRADTESNAAGDKDDRLVPMLAGLFELLPWVKQWHNEPSEEFDGLRLGDYFERFINGECREFGLTHEDLKNWRPSDKKRRPKKKRGG